MPRSNVHPLHATQRLDVCAKDRQRVTFQEVLRGNHVERATINPQGHIWAAANTLSLLPLSGHSGHHRTCCWFDSVANDPTATSAVRCGNGFVAGISHYQSTRLSR